MRQTTLATSGFDRYSQPTRRALFLAEMNCVVPWKQLCALIEPVYPKPGEGHSPVGLERKRRCMTRWMRRFAGIGLGRGPVQRLFSNKPLRDQPRCSQPGK